MCLARSFFSRMIDAQLATGATHDMRILTGSAAMAALTPKRPKAHAPASADFKKRMIFLPVFAGLAREIASFSPRAKIVGGPTDFGKVALPDTVPRSGTWPALVWRNGETFARARRPSLTNGKPFKSGALMFIWAFRSVPYLRGPAAALNISLRRRALLHRSGGRSRRRYCGHCRK